MDEEESKNRIDSSNPLIRPRSFRKLRVGRKAVVRGHQPRLEGARRRAETTRRERPAAHAPERDVLGGVVVVVGRRLALQALELVLVEVPVLRVGEPTLHAPLTGVLRIDLYDRDTLLGGPILHEREESPEEPLVVRLGFRKEVYGL